MSDQPLVSIILSSYNQPEYLKIALESLINQTYKNIEIIIVDDCSENPLNRELILSYVQKNALIIRYIFQSANIGIAKNKNSGYRIANGDFITLLDGDDFYYPEKIECEINMFKNYPQLDVVYSNFAFVDSSGVRKNVWAAAENLPQGNIFKHIVKEDFPQGMLYNYELIKKSIFEKNNYLDESLDLYEDWDFRIRYGIKANAGYTGEVLSAYRRTDNSVSVKSPLTAMINCRIKVIEKNKEIIESDAELKTFSRSFIKKSKLESLFDTSVNYKSHLLSCIKMFLHYPLNLFDIIRSTKYYQFRYKKSSFKQNAEIQIL